MDRFVYRVPPWLDQLTAAYRQVTEPASSCNPIPFLHLRLCMETLTLKMAQLYVVGERRMAVWRPLDMLKVHNRIQAELWRKHWAKVILRNYTVLGLEGVHRA